MLFTALVAMLAVPAQACPTVVTGSAQSLTYDVARTAVLRQGTRTTFTVSVNPSGEAQDFALVMPVPALLAETDIAVLDATTFENLEAYTGPLTMFDAGCGSSTATGDVDWDADGGDGDPTGDVQVEAEYLVGDYAISILSANDSQALFTWLDDNGYHLADATIPVLQDYIDQQMYFLAAEVSPEATLADGSALPPLQVGYDSDAFTIPIRLAAKNSPGQQDMLIHAITDPGTGRVGISNYPEFTIEDKCIWGDPAVDDFGDFYESHFAAHWEDNGRAAWTLEWAGTQGSCSPCSGTSLTLDDLNALGFQGVPVGDPYLTRLHVRYTDITADQDLMLYESGITTPRSTSFADDNNLNQCIDACPPPGWTEPGTDPGSTDSDPTTTEADPSDKGRTKANGSAEGCGCTTSSDGGLGLAALGLILVGARRRNLRG